MINSLLDNLFDYGSHQTKLHYNVNIVLTPDKADNNDDQNETGNEIILNLTEQSQSNKLKT